MPRFLCTGAGLILIYFFEKHVSSANKRNLLRNHDGSGSALVYLLVYLLVYNRRDVVFVGPFHQGIA